VDARPIGVFDSGVGGLTVFRALAAALPDEALVYLGDTARVPYGPKSSDTVRRYAREASRFLRRQDVKMMVVACNTVSSVAMEAMEEGAGVPVVGVILPGARRAVEVSRRGRIGVIGTRATVGSEAYARAIHALRPAAEVVSRACPLLVPLAEEGWTDNAVARQVAEAYLTPLRDAGVDTLVLGCTHYPLLRDVLQETMGAEVALVDSADSVAQEVRRRLAKDQRLAHGPGTTAPRFFVTDAPGPFLDVAERFLGEPLAHLERAELESAPAW
jgi:glutamate racemase